MREIPGNTKPRMREEGAKRNKEGAMMRKEVAVFGTLKVRFCSKSGRDSV